MAKITDADLLDALDTGRPPVKSAGMLADTLAVSRQAVDKRLRDLHDAGQVERVDFGRDVGWYVTHGSQLVEVGPLVASVRSGDGFQVDIEDTNDDASLLVRAGPNGYQCDLWWTDEEGNQKQSNNWVRFGDRESDYPHDNRHDRQPSLTTRGVEISIYDPDPRAPSVGYEGAHIVVGHKDNGFKVRLEWVDEYEEHHEHSVLVPQVDPRYDRERYYDLIEE